MTRRAATVLASLVAALLVLSGPSLAAENGPPYPPPPRINVTTPGATITVTGDDWGPNTQVTIVARDRSGPSSAGTRTTAKVGPDGSFTAPVTVPAGKPGSELVVEIAGADVRGAERAETRVFALSTSANAGHDRVLRPAPIQHGAPRGVVLLMVGGGIVLGLGLLFSESLQDRLPGQRSRFGRRWRRLRRRLRARRHVTH